MNDVVYRHDVVCACVVCCAGAYARMLTCVVHVCS